MKADADAQRLLRHLEAGRAKVGTAAVAGKIVVERDDGAAITLSARALAALARSGLVERRGGTIALTPAGYARLRRGEGGDGFQDQHRMLEAATLAGPAGPEQVVVNLAESPLAQIARRKARDGRPFLSAVEVGAGERLRADFTRGQLMPRLGANWQAVAAGGRRSGGAGGQAELTDAAIAARRRVERALDAVGPELAGVLVDVCCFLKGLETVEMERQWPARSAKIVLKAALGALSRHYEPARAPRGRTDAILHWGAQGYRPSL
ncbi:MAG: DUF6456 domain-containing protein [Rhizobiaceae bacterium]|nr:DUF6456 domain-containing protein [Rhizobiaceae bacterium]